MTEDTTNEEPDKDLYHVSFEYITFTGAHDFVEFNVRADNEEQAIERARGKANQDYPDADVEVRKF